MRNPDLSAITGAFSYTGGYVARRLLDQGVSVTSLSRSPDRSNAFGGAVEAAPLDFSDPDGLRRSMEGAGVFYNTYWIRFAHGRTTFGVGDLLLNNMAWAQRRLPGPARLRRGPGGSGGGGRLPEREFHSGRGGTGHLLL